MRFAFLLTGLAGLLWLAPAAAAAPGRAASCRAALDAARARIAQEEAALRAMLDADAAVLEAPVYRLSEADAALQADFAAARARAEAGYRACLAGERPRTETR